MKISLLILFVLFLSGLAGNAEAERSEGWLKQQKEYREETANARRISSREAYSIFKSGKAILLSVDAESYYKQRHILGSINIPFEKLQKSRLKLPKDQLILVYCR